MFIQKRRSGQCDNPRCRRFVEYCRTCVFNHILSPNRIALECSHFGHIWCFHASLYVSSTLVHSFPEGKTKDIFEIFDHSAIYIFIAGTYTPIMLLVIKGSLGWTLLGIIWGVAIIGVVFKAFYVKKFLFLSTILYIAMGWMIVIVWGPLTSTMPAAGIQLLIAGDCFIRLEPSFMFGAVFRSITRFGMYSCLGELPHTFCGIVLYPSTMITWRI